MAAPRGASSWPESPAAERERSGVNWQHAFAVAAAACMLALVAVWNGHPFFYPDTPTYLRGAEMGIAKLAGEGRLPEWLPPGAPDAQPDGNAAPAGEASGSLTSVEDKVVLAGRSVYYGALLYLSFAAGSLWLAVLAQGLTVAYVLHLLVVRTWGLREGSFLLGVALLAVASPLAVFTGLLMPDVFAGLTVLCIAALGVYWSQLDRHSRWLLAAVLLFSLASHSSHVALAVAMLALGLVLRLWPRWRSLSLRGMGVAAACVAGALLAEAAFSQAVTRFVGAPPLRLPHLTGRLVDMGPGTEYLRQSCPRVSYAACEFLGNYPTTWDDFLFSRDPAKGAFALADPAGKRRMSQEQTKLALAVLRHDPVGVLSGVAADVVRQVGLFQVDVSGVGAEQIESYAGRVPRTVLADLQRTRTLDSHVAHDFFTATTQASVGASLLLAAIVAWRRRRAAAAAPAPGSPSGFKDFAAVVLGGVLANAVVCASLAGALERFQARVIWLVPFVALAWLALARRRRRDASSVAAANPVTAASLPSLERPES